MKRLIACALLVVGCSSDPEEPTADMGTQPDTSTQADSGTVDMTQPDLGGAADMQIDEDSGRAEDMGQDTGTMGLTEMEPNGGATADEVNDLPFATQMSGAIDDGDSDVFFVDATAGQKITLRLEVPGGSPLQPHLAVFDAGRDGDAAGEDYVKIARGDDLELIAMGEGGYFVAVRDARVVDGGTAGGADHTYILTATSEAPQPTAFTFPDTLQGSLAQPGAVDVWSFDGVEQMNMLFDFQAAGDADGRLFVYAASEGDWVARQDDRTVGDPNPLLDAPLFASSGTMLLVVENIAEEATSLGYSIDASSP